MIACVVDNAMFQTARVCPVLCSPWSCSRHDASVGSVCPSPAPGARRPFRLTLSPVISLWSFLPHNPETPPLTPWVFVAAGPTPSVSTTGAGFSVLRPAEWKEPVF